MQRDAITVERFYTEHASALELNLVAGASGLKRIIREPTVNRPGLVLSGFTRYFANKRVQVIGNAEAFFLKSLSPEEQAKRYETFFSYKVPCVVFSRNLHPNKLFLKAAEQARVPIFRCPHGDHEVHQPGHPGAGDDVRPARHRDGQHGGHPRASA